MTALVESGDTQTCERAEVSLIGGYLDFRNVARSRRVSFLPLSSTAEV